MAITLTGNTYNGKYVTEFYSNAIFNAGSLNRISILPNAKNTVKLPSLNLTGNILTADSCTFTASGDVVLTEKSVTPATRKLNAEICISDLEASFMVESLRPGAQNGALPTDFEAYVLDLMKQTIGSSLENSFWTGTTVSNGFNGILVQAAADSNTLKVTATGSAIDSSNVVAELTKVYNAIPSVVALKRNGSAYAVKIYVDHSIAKAYMQAIGNKSNEAFLVGEKPLDFLGIELIVAPLGAKKMFAADPSNVWLVTDLFDDTEQIELIDMRKTTGDDNVRFKGRIKVTAAYKVSQEVVLYA